MSEEQKTEQTGTEITQTGADTQKEGGARRSFGGRKPMGHRKPGGFRKGSRFKGGDRPQPEFEQKIINISRVTRVVKGGRRLSFRVDMVIGDKKGRVGLGSGKATDTSLAIQKAFNHARKNLLTLKLTANNSIPHEVSAKVTSSRIEMMPNKERGLVAGSTLRNVLELAGITDVTTKVHSRSKNKLNNAKAALLALRAFATASAAPKSDEEEKKEERSSGRFNRQSRDSR